MLARIIDFSLDNKTAVICVWLLVAALGLDSLKTLPIDAVPDVTNVQVQVLTTSPGLGPEEVEQFITFPVESAMSGIPSVKNIRSVSKYGLSVVTVVFEDNADIYWARQLISERLVQAREEIPEGYGEPAMGPISSGLGEIYQFEVRGEPMCAKGAPDSDTCFTPMELRSILDWTVAFQLRSVPGVVEVNAFGGFLKTYQVTIDPDRLNSRGLSVAQVAEAIEASNRNAGGGNLERSGEQMLVRGEGLLTSLEDLENVVLSHDEDGAPVRVRDIARVEFSPMLRQGAVTRDGRGEVVVGIVMMLLGANSREVVQNVKARIDSIRSTLPKGVTIDPFYDRTELIDRTVNTVAVNLLEGGLLVIIVLLLLLGNLRGGLIVAAAIPLSMLVAFTGMKWAGLSGNLMSLGAIDFGLIVDGSVVMVENIVRRLHNAQTQVEGADNKLSPQEVVRSAAKEMARPVVFAVSIIMIVYLPILGLRGVEGKMFVPMALTIVFALFGSLICALTLMPVLASLTLRRVSEKEPWLFRLVHRVYRPLLPKVVKHPFYTASVAGIVFVLSLGVIPSLGAEFIPKLDEGAIAMQIWRLPSISLEQSNEISGMAERALKDEFPEIDTLVSRTGRAEIATDPMGVEISDTYIMLNPRGTWRYRSKDALVLAMGKHLERNVPAAAFSFSQPIELRVAELISGVRSDVALHLYGNDLGELKRVADSLAEVLEKVPGAADVKAEQTSGLPLLRVRLDRNKMARYGIRANDALDVIETIGGKRVGTVFEGQERYALQLRFDKNVRDDRDGIGKLRVSSRDEGGHNLIPLAQLATVEEDEGPAQISRDRISRRINVEANVRGRDLASFVAEAKEAVDREVELPEGWSLEWGGQFQNLEAATERLTLLLPLALMLIFVLLFSAFGSARLALLVFLNVPLATTGGLLALWVRGYPLSISAGVGFIALFGVAVLNGVVLLSYAEARRLAGNSPLDAAMVAARSRLRPVLMTALVAALGFVPMALATSAGAEVQRPLATVVIGGLLTSTVLTLLVLPTLYARLLPSREDK